MNPTILLLATAIVGFHDPDLEHDHDEAPALGTSDGHKAVGHDVEFFSLDMTNAWAIRCYRRLRSTALIFGQWSELDEIGAED